MSGKVTADVRLMKHKNGYHTVMVRSQAFALCRTMRIESILWTSISQPASQSSLSRAAYLSATQALSTTSGKVTTDVRLMKHKNG